MIQLFSEPALIHLCINAMLQFVNALALFGIAAKPDECSNDPISLPPDTTLLKLEYPSVTIFPPSDEAEAMLWHELQLVLRIGTMLATYVIVVVSQIA